MNGNIRNIAATRLVAARSAAGLARSGSSILKGSSKFRGTPSLLKADFLNRFFPAGKDHRKSVVDDARSLVAFAVEDEEGEGGRRFEADA